MVLDVEFADDGVALLPAAHDVVQHLLETRNHPGSEFLNRLTAVHGRSVGGLVLGILGKTAQEGVGVPSIGGAEHSLQDFHAHVVPLCC